MHPTGTITNGELDLFGGRAPQRTISTRCTPMVCTASFHTYHSFLLTMLNFGNAGVKCI